MSEVTASRGDEVAPVVSVPDAATHGLVGRPEGVDEVLSLPQPPFRAVVAGDLGLDDGVAEVGVGYAHEDNASGLCVGEVGSFRVSSSEDAAQHRYIIRHARAYRCTTSDKEGKGVYFMS